MHVFREALVVMPLTRHQALAAKLPRRAKPLPQSSSKTPRRPSRSWKPPSRPQQPPHRQRHLPRRNTARRIPGRSVNFSQISAAKPAAARVNDVLGIPGFSCQRLMDVGRKGNRAVDSSRTGVDGESGSAFALPHVLAESGGLSARGGPPSQFVCRGANQGRFAEADLQRNHGKPRRGEVFQGPDLSESGAGCGFVSGREGKDGPVLWLHSRRAGLAAEGQVA